MYTRNYVRIFSEIIVADFASLDPEFQSIIAHELRSGSDNDVALISYDLLSVAMADGYDEVSAYLKDEASEDLHYYLRKLAFKLGRELKEEYQESASLRDILVSSLEAGIDGMDDLITPDDLENRRYLDPDDARIGVSVLLTALLIESLTLTLEDFDEPKKSAGSDSA